MGIFSRKKKPEEPTLPETVNAEVRKDVLVSETLNPQGMVDTIAFDFQVIDDEKILGLFDPRSPFYLPWLDELLPLFSRLLFLSNCAPSEATNFLMDVDLAITRLKYRRKEDDEKRLLNNLRTWFAIRINDSINGWKLNTLTERRRRILLTQQELKEKRGWLRR